MGPKRPVATTAAGRPPGSSWSPASRTSSPRSTVSSTSAWTTTRSRSANCDASIAWPPGHRRRNRIDETADPDEEREAALEAGLRPDEAALAALFAHARRGETDEAVVLIGELVDAEPLSMAAFERYEALGLIPTGLLDRARAR